MERQPNKINIHVQRFEEIGRGRARVKIAEKGITLKTMNYDGKDFTVINALGRGRYIMKEGLYN